MSCYFSLSATAAQGDREDRQISRTCGGSDAIFHFRQNQDTSGAFLSRGLRGTQLPCIQVSAGRHGPNPEEKDQAESG